ncbi:hypothetical protein evm_011135 [Chilo suppressalis]|nr:hypothetical protein evm_011135 [Chilo suppressalis]
MPFLHPTQRTTGTRIKPEIKILVALQFYAMGSYQKNVGNDFNLGQSQTSICESLTEVTNALSQTQILRYVMQTYIFCMWMHHLVMQVMTLMFGIIVRVNNGIKDSMILDRSTGSWMTQTEVVLTTIKRNMCEEGTVSRGTTIQDKIEDGPKLSMEEYVVLPSASKDLEFVTETDSHFDDVTEPTLKKSHHFTRK